MQDTTPAQVIMQRAVSRRACQWKKAIAFSVWFARLLAYLGRYDSVQRMAPSLVNHFAANSAGRS